MAKLNQVIAAEKGVKARSTAAVTNTYHELQKKALYAGFVRRYTPADEEGETFPDERTNVQRRVEKDLLAIEEQLTGLLDVVYTKDVANTQTQGAVVVDGVELFTAPVPTLLFVLKELEGLRPVLRKLPVLDAAEVWTRDPGAGGWRTEPVSTNKTRKVPKVLVKYPHTDKHPAQVDVYNEDVVVGAWTRTGFSGEVPAERRDELVARLDRLSDAVKYAVEAANQVDVEQMHLGETLFAFLLA